MSTSIHFVSLNVNTDTTEGRGVSVVHARFVNKKDAIAVCKDERFWKKHGVMGTPINSEYAVKEETIRIYESAQEYWANHDVDELRKRALNKLTDEEKRVLGLM